MAGDFDGGKRLARIVRLENRVIKRPINTRFIGGYSLEMSHKSTGLGEYLASLNPQRAQNGNENQQNENTRFRFTMQVDEICHVSSPLVRTSRMRRASRVRNAKSAAVSLALKRWASHVCRAKSAAVTGVISPLRRFLPASRESGSSVGSAGRNGGSRRMRRRVRSSGGSCSGC